MGASKAKQWSANDISDTPHMESAGRDLLQKKLGDCKVFLEFGAGGSTIFAAKQGVSSIFSVESDRSFLAAVSDRLTQNEGMQPQFFPVFVDLGPTGDWGFPTDKSTSDKWPNYCVKVWEDLRLNDNHPDVVLIDGRFRVACFLSCLVFAREGCTILFDDYVDRPNYHVIEKFLMPVSTAGRMAEFIVPSDIRTEQLIIELVKASASVW